MSESNLPPEQWRPYFDRAGIEFGYRPLATRAGLTHTRVHRLIRGGGTTDEAIQQVADAFGVKASKVRELRGEPAVEVEPFILSDDAGRLTHSERDVVRSVVRALLDARDRNAELSADTATPPTAQPGASRAEDQKTATVTSEVLHVAYNDETPPSGAEDQAGHDADAGTDPEGQAADDARPNVWRDDPSDDKPDDLRDRRSRRQAGSRADDGETIAAELDTSDTIWVDGGRVHIGDDGVVEDPADAWAARKRDPRFAPEDPGADGIGEESQETTDE